MSFAVEQGWHDNGETGSFPVIDVYARPDQYSEESAEEAREVTATLAQFDANQLAAQSGIERTAKILFAAGEDTLARRYLTEQSHAAAAEAMRLMQSLSESIEARTRLRYGIGSNERGAR